jgi:isoleucyl-tRNA synthetase
MAFNFSEAEAKTLEFWKKEKIFEKTLEKTKDKKPFVFYDGPPFATGTPHYGHLLQSLIKDVIPRYKTMQGFYVTRQWGWDCHGLPIENIVEKELGTRSKKDILAMGVKKFNDLCREKIFTFIDEWENVIPRFGRWVDMEHAYRTMDFEYMQSEWWAFKELYKKGLVYEDYRSMHVCPRCETTLSQGEVADGYKDVKDLSVTVKMKIKNPEKIGLKGNVYMLAWTTTPWTLPGNVAIAVGPKISYVEVVVEKEHYLLAEERIKEVLVDRPYIAEKKFSGKDLVGLEYEPLFDYYSGDKNLKNRENGWKVYAADFVTADSGTGIAHEAPAFGAEDWELLKQVNLPFVQHVKMDGTMKEEVLDFVGMDLKPRAKDIAEEIREADLTVVKFLDAKGLVFSYEKYPHSYPHCWRCDTALLNYATSSWFVAVEKIKPTLLKTAKHINWAPEHIKEGRFGQWLQGARDWSISRQRFWANTIPVWKCDKCNTQEVFASADELEKMSGQKVTDLHKDVVDEVVFSCKCGGSFYRVPEVLDTWFDSGSVPFAMLHYPAENREGFKHRFPADFIGEAQDQTRAWFYYQHVLAGALFGELAFKNCMVTGIVLAEDGKKMSKKLKNYPDPMEMINKYGADAMRFYILSSPVVQAENLSFKEKELKETQGKVLNTLQNVVEFYHMYAGVKNEDVKGVPPKTALDLWITSRLHYVVRFGSQELDAYDPVKYCRAIKEFIEDLSLWYVRRSRKRFHESFEGRNEAVATLYNVLLVTSKMIAPVMPFFAEEMYRGLKAAAMPESVHLCDWPKIDSGQDVNLEKYMEEVRTVVNMALGQRAATAIKVRQPLNSLTIKSRALDVKHNAEFLDLIKDEVNVKEIIFDDTIKSDINLDLIITSDLKEEGIVREIVRFIQDQRKEQGLKPEDRILVEVAGNESLLSIIERHGEWLLKEIRAKELSSGAAHENSKGLAIEDQKLSITIKKA